MLNSFLIKVCNWWAKPLDGFNSLNLDLLSNDNLWYSIKTTKNLRVKWKSLLKLKEIVKRVVEFLLQMNYLAFYVTTKLVFMSKTLAINRYKRYKTPQITSEFSHELSENNRRNVLYRGSYLLCRVLYRYHNNLL